MLRKLHDFRSIPEIPKIEEESKTGKSVNWLIWSLNIYLNKNTIIISQYITEITMKNLFIFL